MGELPETVAVQVEPVELPYVKVEGEQVRDVLVPALFTVKEVDPEAALLLESPEYDAVIEYDPAAGDQAIEADDPATLALPIALPFAVNDTVPVGEDAPESVAVSVVLP